LVSANASAWSRIGFTSSTASHSLIAWIIASSRTGLQLRWQHHDLRNRAVAVMTAELGPFRPGKSALQRPVATLPAK